MLQKVGGIGLGFIGIGYIYLALDRDKPLFIILSLLFLYIGYLTFKGKDFMHTNWFD